MFFVVPLLFEYRVFWIQEHPWAQGREFFIEVPILCLRMMSIGLLFFPFFSKYRKHLSLGYPLVLTGLWLILFFGQYLRFGQYVFSEMPLAWIYVGLGVLSFVLYWFVKKRV